MPYQPPSSREAAAIDCITLHVTENIHTVGVACLIFPVAPTLNLFHSSLSAVRSFMLEPVVPLAVERELPKNNMACPPVGRR